jgi:hypothetical protein
MAPVLSRRWSPWAVGLTLIGAVHLSLTVAAHDGFDFRLFRATTAALLAGTPAYAPFGADAFRDMNPPLFHVAIWPLLSLSAPAALWVWRGVNAIAFVWALGRMAPPGFWASRMGGWWAVALVWSPATALALAAGQVAGLLAAGLVLGYQWLDTRPRLAGLLLGALIAIKPFLGLLIVWGGIQRRWTVLLGMAAGVATALGIGVAVWGLSPYRQWFDALGAVQWTRSPFSASWARMATVLPAAVYMAAYLALTGATVWSLRRDLRWRLVVVGAVLLSPLGWVYYLWLVAPFVLTWPAPWLAVLLWVPLTVVLSPPFAALAYAYPAGVIAVWVALLRHPDAERAG